MEIALHLRGKLLLIPEASCRAPPCVLKLHYEHEEANIAKTHILIPHGGATHACNISSPAVEGVTVTLERLDKRQLVAVFALNGDVQALALPPQAPPARTDYLWQTTCCEMFIQDSAGEGYCEFNFSPSTCWAAYRFDSFRSNMRDLPLNNAPHITVESTDRQLVLTAIVNITDDALPKTLDNARMGLTAVVKQRGGMTSYWALAHPFPKPDFHHADGFIAALNQDI